MTSSQLLALHLRQIEQTMRAHQLWQIQSPGEYALASAEPFCIDTLHPLEWLQWVLIPRMDALLQTSSSLPNNFAIASYFELSLENNIPGRSQLLLSLRQLDALFIGSV